MEQVLADIQAHDAKNFLKAIASVYDKVEKRDTAREHLQSQISRLRRVAKRHSPNRRSVEKELKILGQKISDVLETEKKVLGIDSQSSYAMKQLQDKIDLMEHKFLETERSKEDLTMANELKIDHLMQSLRDIKQRLESFISMQQDREQKIVKLENKIRSSSNYNANAIVGLELQMKQLQKRHLDLKHKGHSSFELRRIEAKLNSIKQRMEQIKTSL